ncbi:hypothetical protein [Paenibacillus camerounensis]|uniref:hypothetical protein n=1 Tax=Paenibacillus camerounensis TaxID=1243663 RepID=UPI0005A796F4|nr:hypothetical protein [Paenibacillus camerounensis]
MIKKWGLSAAALLLTAAVILPGCASKESPKEAISSSANKALTMNSYEMKSVLTVNKLSIDAPAGANDDTTGMVLNMLQNADISINAVHQSEPMQTELTMVLNLKGDMAMSFNIPMVLTGDKMYVKIPSIPFLPLPETVVGKFLELDPQELAAQQGVAVTPGTTIDTKKVQDLSNEVLSTLLGEYDEETYFKNVKPEEAGIPEEVDAKQVVQFQVTNSNVKEALTILVNNALPKVIDVLNKEEYKELLKIDETKLAEVKQELQSGEARAEFDKSVADLDSYLTVNNFQLNTALNGDDFPEYQNLLMDVVVKNPEQGQNINLSLTGSNQYSKINEKQTFVIGIPQDGDVITMEELQQQFGAMSTY